MNVAVVVPVLDASRDWSHFCNALLENLQSLGMTRDRVLIVDSSSSDNTAELARSAGYRLHSILRSEFDHGATRQLGADCMPDAEVVVYLTQDAVLASPDAIAKLLQVFGDPDIGAAFGRQIPRLDAGAIEAHTRLFNYPTVSRVRSLATRQELGAKSIFFSDSFSAYRRSALMTVGGFPPNVIFGEDMMLAGRMHLAGWKTAYVAEAAVFHSHGYTLGREFRRYFDVGVLYARERWLRTEFGGASGEGKRFVLSELRYLAKHAPLQIPNAMVRTALKFLGYKLGSNEAKLNAEIRLRLTMNKGYWSKL